MMANARIFWDGLITDFVIFFVLDRGIDGIWCFRCLFLFSDILGGADPGLSLGVECLWL